MLGTDETPEMTLARDLKPFINKKAYQDQAKKAMTKNRLLIGS